MSVRPSAFRPKGGAFAKLKPELIDLVETLFLLSNLVMNKWEGSQMKSIHFGADSYKSRVCWTCKNVKFHDRQTRRCKKWVCWTLSLIFKKKKVILPNFDNFFILANVFLGWVHCRPVQACSLGRRVGFRCWLVKLHIVKQKDPYWEPAHYLDLHLTLKVVWTIPFNCKLGRFVP